MTVARRKIIVVGAGGHARVLVSVLGQLPDVQVVGVADRDASTLGEAIGTTKIVTTFDRLPDLLNEGVSWAALAIGDNQERAYVSAGLKTAGFSIATVRHPSAIVEPDVRIGEGAVICPGAILCAGVAVGPGAIINTGALVDHEGAVNAFAHIGPGSCLAGRVTVGERSFVGLGTRVIENVKIGSDCVVGAGSVVLSDLPDGVVAYGVPAKVGRHV